MSLYRKKEAYLSTFKQAADAALANGTILPRVLNELLLEASETWDKLQ